MDHLQTRLEALEHQMCTVNRRLRWWRGLAAGLLALAVLTWALPSGTAQEDAVTQGDKEKKGLAQRVAALESLLKHFSREGDEVFRTGANLHLVNSLGKTDCTDIQGETIPGCTNGLGNLIVGYNEPRDPALGDTIRTGSHNVVVGPEHNFSGFGGMVVGQRHTISRAFAVVSGGRDNTASGAWSVVNGGGLNTASGGFTVVSGGENNTASGGAASVSGGAFNTASGTGAMVSGGEDNTASGGTSSVSGGLENTASGEAASVSGGNNRTAAGDFDWVAGPLFADE